MEPTRDEVQNKIDELVADPTKNKEDYKANIANWLTEMGCPPDKKERILDDLISYSNW